jgi:hypothetical protein
MERCSVAFKEWGVICEALGRGTQTLILRKGGIDEGRDGFRVAHEKFWMYPTRFHASREQLTPAVQPLLDEVAARPVEPGAVRLSLLAEVVRVVELATLDEALSLEGLHGWSEETVRARFAYRRPGLVLLVVRMREIAEPHQLTETPEYAGCKSWVPLAGEFDASGAQPVLADAAFEERVREIERRLGR